MNAPPHVAVIGGGWAGLACAEALLSTSEVALTISLLEAAPHFGGRARGLLWTPKGQDQTFTIDNGQHLTLGAYRETFGLLARARAPNWQEEVLHWTGLGEGTDFPRSWKVSSAAFPLRLVQSLVGASAPKGWPLGWRIALLRALPDMIWQPPQGQESVGAWLRRKAMPSAMVDHFWQPLTEGALNTGIEEADLRFLTQVLSDSLCGPQSATAVRTPLNNLSIDGVDPIIQRLEAGGVHLLPGRRLTRIRSAREIEVIEKGEPKTISVDAIVLAMPANICCGLWADSGLEGAAVFRRWQAIKYRAITTIWVLPPKQVQDRFRQFPSWFVLDALPGFDRPVQAAVIRGQVLALVISAQHAEHLREPSARPSLEERVSRQVQAHFGFDLSACPQKWITEQEATWAADTTHPWPDDREALGFTDLPGLFRAADDLEAGLPATIESAVRSGRRTAQTLIETLRLPERQPAD